MRILLFPSEVTEERKKGKANFQSMNDMDNKGLLVITDLSAIKINFITPDPSIVFDEARGLLSCSLRVNNVPFTRLKNSEMSTVLAKMPDFKNADQVKEFIDMLSKDPDVIPEVNAKDLVFDNPLEGHKSTVVGDLSVTEKQGSADTTKKAVEGKCSVGSKSPTVIPDYTVVVDPPRSQVKEEPKAKALFNKKGKGKKGKKEFSQTLKDPSQLPHYMKEVKPAPPVVKETVKSNSNSKTENKVATPSPKQTSSPIVDDLPSSNDLLKEKLAKRLDDDAKLWPGGLVIKSIVPFKEKGYIIGHLFNPKTPKAQLLLVGTPVDGNMPKLTLVFPDEGKAKYYLEGAGKHPKLQKFMEMCSVKPLKDFKDDTQLAIEALLVNDPKTYLEYIINRSE